MFYVPFDKCNKNKKISLILNMSHVHNIFSTKIENVQEAVDTDDDNRKDNDNYVLQLKHIKRNLKIFWLVSSIT